MLTKDAFRAGCHAAIKKAAPQLRELTEADDVRAFAVLGLDSLDAMSFLLELETQLDVSVGEVDLKQVNTIDKLYSYYVTL